MSNNIAINNDILHKKSERIASAIFLVSNIISDGELLKTKLRTISLDTVSLCVAIKDSMNNDKFQAVKLLEKKVSELISLLDIASVSGLVSEMNASIIKKELGVFLALISDNYKTFFVNHTGLSGDFFGELNKSIESNVKDNFLENNNYVLNGIIKKDEKDRLDRKAQRSKHILDLISKKGLVSIKDIAMSIKGCSEKTVQRELNSLIKEGLIEKVGERRWSKYSMRSG